MTSFFTRRDFLALMSALPGLRLLSRSSEEASKLPKYVPSFLHPNDKWAVLRSDRGFEYEVVDIDTGKRVFRLNSSACDTHYGSPLLMFDPSGRFLVLAYFGKWSNELKRWDLEKEGDVLWFDLKQGRLDESCDAASRTPPEQNEDGPQEFFMLPEPGGILRFLGQDWTLQCFKCVRERKHRIEIQWPSNILWASVRTANRRHWSWRRADNQSHYDQYWVHVVAEGIPKKMLVATMPMIHCTSSGEVRLAYRRRQNGVLVWSGYSTIKEFDATTAQLRRCISATMPQTGLLAFGSSRRFLCCARPLGNAVRWDRYGKPTIIGTPKTGQRTKPPIVEMGIWKKRGKGVTFFGLHPEDGPVAPYPSDDYIYTMGVRTVACSAKALALGLDSGEILLGSGSGDHGKPWFPLGSHAEAIRALAFIPDSNLLLSGSRDGTLKLWDIVSKGVGKDLPSHAARVNSISVSRTGLAASAGPDGIRLWEIPGCAPKLAIETNGAWVSDVSLSPDATRLAGGLLDGSVRVWDPDSGSLHWSAQADEGWCAAVAIHPNGRLVAAGYELGALILWDLEKGTRIKKVRVDGITEWQRNPCPIHALAWSADGMALAVAFGNIVRIYDQNLRTSEGPGWLLPLDWNDEYT